jgi:hypothetical protein
MHEGIIKVTTQFPDRSPIEPKGVNVKWHNDYGVLTREKCKITWIDWAVVPINEKYVLWELIKAHYIFPSEHEEHGKRATILVIGRAFQRFRHALNKFYVLPGVSPFNRFGFITPNEWNTIKELHTTPESMSHNNRMKELIQKNKFKHGLGPDGYKVAILLWTKKGQELCEAGIPDPLEGCTLCMRNWIRGWSRIDNKGQLITSNLDITRVIENAKDLITKRRPANSSRSARKTNSVQPSRPKNIEVTHELSLQLHRGRKGLQRISICTRSVKDTI